MQVGNFEGVAHSRCVQRRVSAPTDAAAVFNDSSGADICLVAVPRTPVLCCQFTQIPSGFFVLYQRWYQNQGQLDPGFKCAPPPPPPSVVAGVIEPSSRRSGRRSSHRGWAPTR